MTKRGPRFEPAQRVELAKEIRELREQKIPWKAIGVRLAISTTTAQALNRNAFNDQTNPRPTTPAGRTAAHIRAALDIASHSKPEIRDERTLMWENATIHLNRALQAITAIERGRVQ